MHPQTPAINFLKEIWRKSYGGSFMFLNFDEKSFDEVNSKEPLNESLGSFLFPPTTKIFENNFPLQR